MWRWDAHSVTLVWTELLLNWIELPYSRCCPLLYPSPATCSISSCLQPTLTEVTHLMDPWSESWWHYVMLRNTAIPVTSSRTGFRAFSESHNRHPVTLNLPVHSLYQRPPLASLQCPCPVPHLAAQAQRAPVQVAPIAVHLRHHPRAAHSRLRMLQPRDKQFSQYIAVYITRTAWDGALFQQPACGHKRSSKPSSDKKPNGQLERPTAAYRRTEASCQSAAEPTTARLSASSCKYTTSPVSPKTSKWQGV